MKKEKNRKCDTTKYKKRRTKEKKAREVRMERQKREDIERGRIIRVQQEKARQERAQKRPLIQKLTNVIAGEVYRRDERYVHAMSVKRLLEFGFAFGANPRPHFPVLPEEPEENRLDGDYIEVVK